MYKAYKAGHVQSGNWHWAVGIQTGRGHPSQVASINHIACWSLKIDPRQVAETMAKALNEHPSISAAGKAALFDG